MHRFNPDQISESVARFEAAFRTLIRDRYQCSAEEVERIRNDFDSYAEDAIPISWTFDAGGRLQCPDHVLEVLDEFAADPTLGENHRREAREWDERTEQRGREMAALIASEGLTCRNCRSHSRDFQSLNPSWIGCSLFRCGACGSVTVPYEWDAK